VMVGGADEDVARAGPLFEAMGERVVHVGPQAHGEMAKVIANTVTAINAAAIGEALTMARAAGLDLGRFLEVARAGSSGSTMLELKGEAMVEHDFEPLFRLDHMLKDVRHCLSEAEALGIDLTLAKAAEKLYAAAAEAGHGDEDFAAVITAAENARK
jgi:3-hydroxyisobutyrate dehydrogenase-like beta-hydroxyacid dehydrogenase